MTSIENKIRIARLQEEWSNSLTLYNPAFGLYPKNVAKNCQLMSLKGVSKEEMIKHYYLIAFFASRPFHNIYYAIKQNSLFQAAKDLEVDMTAPDPEEDFLLKLYRVWLVGKNLEFCPDEPQYVYKRTCESHTLEELEEGYDQHLLAKKEAKDQKPFWKFWK